MSKFSSTRPQPSAPIRTTTEQTLTHEDAPAYARDAKSELFLLAVTNMVSEDTFYESAGTRDDRFTSLIHQVTVEDPEWMRRFIPWLRSDANMRSAPIVALAEYVKAGGPGGRSLIARTLARADEPAEMVAYWHQRHGRALPAAIKRGVADAAVNLYNQHSALRYDGKSRAYRMGDVVELTHPKPNDAEQSELFAYLVSKTHKDETLRIGERLDRVHARHKAEQIPKDHRRAWMDHVDPASWEWFAGWVGAMDAKAWKTVIPHMGYMALLRNLRNFDEAGVSDQTADYVRSRISDPEAVARSRQFPYRFWSAYRHATSLRWADALERALDLATSNIPKLGGRTLVLTDTSASMTRGGVSARSNIAPFEIAGVFAASMAKACENVTLVSWADEHTELPVSLSVLRTVETISGHIGKDGHGTVLRQALTTYDGHDRVVIFSDMQIMDGSRTREHSRSSFDVRRMIPKAPIYSFNVGGYAPSAVKAGTAGIYEVGGFSDAVFKMLPLLERSTGWPF